ncbi:MAG: ASCH domain-containing protein, partial [Thermococcus sp.]|nr:ASCH domain-containing protein [Thermococcus sp.]
DEDAFLDGFSSREELIKALKEHYKYVNDESKAHVVVFRLVEKFDKPVMSSDYAYEGNLPVEIAENALKYLDLPEEDRKLIELFLKTGSLRKAAYRLGGLNKRYLIREALRRAYEELKKKGIMGPKV